MQTPAASGGRTGVRRDIQCLRGIAVLLVLAYHGRFGLFRQGFLGVDVFFVISGFLITGMVVRDLDAGRFGFREFYWRRAKRLLPAAYVVVLLTSVAASLLLTRVELLSYIRQVAGTLSFTANVVLWRETNYFEPDAELKPLMHTWSLSLEEQFYLLLPLALWLVPGRWRRPAVAGALVASAIACFALAPNHPTGTFYLLPTRAWELLLGAAGALWFPAAASGPAATARRLAGNASLIVLVALPLLTLDPVHPRLDAAVICLATLVLIRARPALLEQGLLARGLAQVGDMSYSLYLVHWPILAFLRILYLDTPPATARVVALLASVGLAAALYRLVENPVRHAALRPTPARLSWLAAASAATLLLPMVALLRSNPSHDWAQIRRFNYGLGEQCDAGASFEPTPACRTSAHPRLLVWGDSYAMHLVPGLVASDTGLGILQGTRSACGPTLDVAPIERGNVAAARECLEFNRSVLDFVRRSPEIEYVVLAASLELYVAADARILTLSGIEPGRPAVVADALARVASALRAAGRRVVLVGSPPTTGADLGGCLERLRTGLPVAGEALLADCSIDAARYQERRRDEIGVARRVSQAAGVPVFPMSALLCDASRCRTEDESTPLYLDYGHLTHSGSELLGRKYRLLPRVVGESR